MQGTCNSCGPQNDPDTSTWLEEGKDGAAVHTNDGAGVHMTDASVACGHVYVDNGENPTPVDNSLLTIVATLAKDGAGRVVGEALVLHGESIGALPTACAMDVALPLLGGVRVVGLPRHPSQVKGGVDVQVTLHKVVVVVSDEKKTPVASMLADRVLPEGSQLSVVGSKQVPQDAVWYDGEAGSLRVEGLDEAMVCPQGWVVTWTVASMPTVSVV